MFLEEISEIFIGIILKRKEAKYESEFTNEYEVFNLKSYEERKMKYETFYSNENLDTYVAKKGDLLFRVAYPLKIIMVDDEIEGKLITNQYCIIRNYKLNNNIYNFDFLKSYLESDDTKKQIEKFLIGNSIRAIPVAKIRTIEIPEISIEKQKEIVYINNRWNKQKRLYEKLIIEKERYYKNLVNKMIKGE